MHILKIIHGYPPDYNAGSEVYSQSIVNELKKKHKITVFTREENDYEPDFKFRKETKDNIDFVYVNMARGKDGYNHEILNRQFAELISEIKPDIAHVGHLNHLSTGIIDVLNNAEIPIIFTLHDFWLMCPRGQFLQRNFDGKNIYKLCDIQGDNKCANSCYKMYFSDKMGENYYTNWVNNRMKITSEIIKKVDLFIAPSKYLINRFINDFNMPKDKIIYLDYGFPVHYLQPVEPKTNGIFTFGYIGTHIPAKGLNLLIKAFGKIEKPAKLKIFGRMNGQNTRALKKMAKESKNPIEFCGEYRNQNLASTVFSKIDAIVVPSIWGENSPLVIHEAQTCKIPVITADFGGMKEYVAHNINGLLFEHRNTESLYEQMKFAVNNSEQMAKLGQNGYLYSRNGKVPNIEDHCKGLMNLYKKII
jgi:glycosyltransferase involved in cell wall biosynthesis